jgi:hypothetical protein
MKQGLPEPSASDSEGRRGLVRELARTADVVIEVGRSSEVAKLTAATLDAVQAQFVAEAFGRKPADFLVVLRSSSDE